MPAEKSPAARAHEAINRLRPTPFEKRQFSTDELVDQAHAALDEALREAMLGQAEVDRTYYKGELRAERVRVLEEVKERLRYHFRHVGDGHSACFCIPDEMLKEARAEGASEMVDESPQRRPPGTTAGRAEHGATPPVALGRSESSRPPSEEPEAGGAHIPLTYEALKKLQEGARRSTRLTGKDMAVTVGPVPEPGGGSPSDRCGPWCDWCGECGKERGE